jgi:hypothetical protein
VQFDHGHLRCSRGRHASEPICQHSAQVIRLRPISCGCSASAGARGRICTAHAFHVESSASWSAVSVVVAEITHLALDAEHALAAEALRHLAHHEAPVWVLPCPLKLKRLDLRAAALTIDRPSLSWSPQLWHVALDKLGVRVPFTRAAASRKAAGKRMAGGTGSSGCKAVQGADPRTSSRTWPGLNNTHRLSGTSNLCGEAIDDQRHNPGPPPVGSVVTSMPLVSTAT